MSVPATAMRPDVGFSKPAATISNVEAIFLSGNDLTLKAAQLGAFSTVAGNGLVDRIIISGGGTADLTGASVTGIEEIRGSANNNVITLTDVLTAAAVLQLVDFSVSASTGLRDHFSHQWGCPLGAIKCSRGAHQIFIDGLGTQEALLTSPSRIIEGGNNQHAREYC